MAIAKKTKSGSWRVRVYSHKDASGKQHYKSFTCDDPSPRGKRKCEKMAAEWAANRETIKGNGQNTFGQCLDEYISLRSAVLSPNTIREYKRSRKADIQDFMKLQIDRITQNDVQKAINGYALNHAPKTVKNLYGVITAVMGVYRPDMKLRTKLPQVPKHEIVLPTQDDILRLLKAVEGTDLEIPVLLATFGPMRRGEICALRSDQINGNIVHVKYAMAQNENKKWVRKVPKTTASDRYIEFPDFVGKKLAGMDGYVTKLNPPSISNRYRRLVKKLGIKGLTFHGLRHYSSSLLHSLGVSDKAIQDRAGWASDYAMKQIYRHVISEEQKKATTLLNDHFSALHDAKHDAS